MRFETLKEKGDQHFRAKEYNQAIIAYSQAIDIDPANHVLYSNRSAAYLYLGYNTRALSDGQTCISLVPGWTKGYCRKAAALYALKKYYEAIVVYKDGLLIDPEDNNLKIGLALAVKLSTNSAATNPTSSWHIKSIGKYLIASVVFLSFLYNSLSAMIASFIVDGIPYSQDLIIGRAAVRTADYTVLHDSFGVGDIGRNLVSQLPAEYRESFRFEFRVIDEDFVNAFAYPGGSIFITDELLKLKYITKDEIAAVISHEIGHVISRHSMKTIISNELTAWIIKAFWRKDDAHIESFSERFAEMMVEKAARFCQLSYSRENEFEADSKGIELLKKSKGNYNPKGMILFFERLMVLSGEKYGDNLDDLVKVSNWFSTHPGTEDRIIELKKLL